MQGRLEDDLPSERGSTAFLLFTPEVLMMHSTKTTWHPAGSLSGGTARGSVISVVNTVTSSQADSYASYQSLLTSTVSPVNHRGGPDQTFFATAAPRAALSAGSECRLHIPSRADMAAARMDRDLWHARHGFLPR